MKMPIRFKAGGRETLLVPIEPWYHNAMWEILNSLAANKDLISRQRVIKGEARYEGLQRWAAFYAAGGTVGFVAIRRGVPVGYAQISKTEEVGTGVLGVIALLPCARGMGISHKLLSATMAKAQKVLGITKVTLETFACNKVARALYAKHGFVLSSERAEPKMHHGELKPRVKMFKVLDGAD